jgi:hypothetical protein
MIMNRSPRLAIRLVLVTVAAAGWIFAGPETAFAQQGPGVRAGVSADPDQFIFGGHYDTGPLIERLSFRPNAEVGVGDDRTTFSANFEFAYWFPIKKKPWSVYVGGGPALLVYHHDEGSDHAGRTDTEPGFNLLIGVAHRGGLFAEVKAGLIDSPAVKFTVGFTFR